MRTREQITGALLGVFLTAVMAVDAGAETVLVDEDWQTPLNTDKTRLDGNPGPLVSPIFSGWTFYQETYSYREDNEGWVPGDSSIIYPNQVIEQNQNSCYADYTNFSHSWASNDTYYLMVEASPHSWSGENQRYIRPQLLQQDDTLLWQAPQDSTTAVPLYSQISGELADWNSEQRFWFTIEGSNFLGGTQGQPIKLRLTLSGARGLAINNVKLVLGPLPADTTPPTPDPLTWVSDPAVVDYTQITMKAISARDTNDYYDVEYLFTNTVRGTSSGWQEERTWTETGLDYDTTYTYKVKARDKSPNLNESTIWSAEKSATTPTQDLTPPSPDPLAWKVAPTNGDYGTITMTVSNASDVSGVEYFFTNTVRGTSSGWQDSTTWNDGGLDHDTLYSYKAKARDKSLDQNESTSWSSEESETTLSVPEGTLVITRFQCPLFNNGTVLYDGDFTGWVLYSKPKARREGSDGVPHDTDVSPNQAVQFEYTNDYVQYDISHNWAGNEVYTLTLNAGPQSWHKEAQRYVRPSLREQDGTVLWAPDENMTGPEKTALPINIDYSGSNWQDSAELSFTFTINASDFASIPGASEGQPIAVRVASSGQRGTYIDNVTLSVGKEPTPGLDLIVR